jgi:hypothetical protein
MELHDDELYYGGPCGVRFYFEHRKSTNAHPMMRRDYAFVDEPGCGLVRSELAAGGSALRWLDKGARAHR